MTGRDYGRIFAEKDFSDYLGMRLQRMKVEIYSESPQFLLNVNDEEYLDHLESAYSVDPLTIDFDNMSVSSRERLVPAERHPGGFDVRAGGGYPRLVVTYHIPFDGSVELLWCRPSTWISRTPEVYVEGGCICFEIIDYYGDANRVKSQANSIITQIRTQAGYFTRDVESFNESLRSQAKNMFEDRRKQLMDQNKVLSSLGVPIRKSASVPETFAVPTVRKKVIARPVVPPSAGVPVPTLNETIYREILQTIYDMGKVFERLPSTYAGKDEETLRDHLILQLEPRFEGSTTGETFNKSGKTDILIRHEKSNVFVAECKFWRGKVEHIKTINQLLLYLTWRDSKTAIIYFVKRKEITPVLEEITKRTAAHPCYIRHLEKKDDSWQMFEFHFPNDPGCKVMVAVLTFHIPEP